MTHNLFVEMLSGDMPSVRKQILCQYVSFFKNLRQSHSNLMEEFPTLDPWTHGAGYFKTEYKGYPVSNIYQWRLPLQKKLLYQHREMDTMERMLTPSLS